MFWAEMWKISEFLSENFHFFGGKIFRIFELVCFRNDIQQFLNILQVVKWNFKYKDTYEMELPYST